MRFRINHSKVISQANSIAGNVDQLAEQIRLLDQMEQDCRAVWKGEAADIFISKIRKLRNEMNRTRCQLSNLTSTIKYCADRIQNEDRETERLAAALKSGH